eukprot:4787175-Amphidinium_carterae.1
MPPTVVEPPAMLMVPALVVRDPLPSAGVPSHGGASGSVGSLRHAAVLVVWRHLVEVAPAASSLGKWINSEPNVDAKMAIIADTFASKATGTVRLRGRDFGRFVAWATSEKVDLNPICESIAYSYCLSLRADGASRTSSTVSENP